MVFTFGDNRTKLMVPKDNMVIMTDSSGEFRIHCDYIELSSLPHSIQIDFYSKGKCICSKSFYIITLSKPIYIDISTGDNIFYIKERNE